jgi:hypothetical protein
VEGIAAEDKEEVCEDVAGAMGHAGGYYGGRAEQAGAIEAREDLAGGGEEGGEAEGEEVWRVAGAGEDVAGNLEVAGTDLDEDVGLEDLRC